MKYQSENVISFHQFVHKYNHWGDIFEENADYKSISQNALPIKRYTNSLSKKRLLKQWDTFRMQVQIAPQLPNVIERVVYQNVYDDLKSLLIECFQEDSEEPFESNSLLDWLKGVKQIAEELDKVEEAFYWQEMIQYLKTCTQLNVIDDFTANN